MGAHREITVQNLWSGVSVTAAGTTLTSSTVDLSSLSQDGTFSLQYYVTEAAGASVYATYQLSNDGTNFVESTTGYKIATGSDGFHDDAGVARDGRDLIEFTPALAPLMQICVWEVNSAGARLDLWLAMQ